MKFLTNTFFSLCALAISSIFITSCGGDDDSSAAKSNSATITIDGTTLDYSIQTAKFSYVHKFYGVVFSNGSNYVSVTIRSNEPDELIPSTISTSCELSIDMIIPNASGDTYYSEEISNLTINSIEKSSDAYTISASGSNIMLGNLSSQDYVIDDLDFTVSFSIPSLDDLDQISFKADGEEFTYYGEAASGFISPYFIPNPDPSETELILTTNTGDENPRNITFEGFSIIDVSPTYPPVAEKITGYSEGLRMSFMSPENGSNCLLSNLNYFSNGDNLLEDFNTCIYEITDVTERSTDYLLTGTFEGIITNDNENTTMSITEGTFKVSVPKLN